MTEAPQRMMFEVDGDLAGRLTDPDLPLLVISGSVASAAPSDLHAHAKGQFVFTRDGSLSLATPDRTWVTPADLGIWIPPHMVHGSGLTRRISVDIAYFSERLSARLPNKPFVVAVSPLLREALVRATRWKAGPTCRADWHVIGIILAELAAPRRAPLQLREPADPRLRRVTDALKANPRPQLDLDTCARIAAMSRRTLVRAFRAQLGMTLGEWNRHMLALRAIEALTAGKPVGTIAIDLGYENASAFIAMFQRVIGCTPGQYIQ